MGYYRDKDELTEEALSRATEIARGNSHAEAEIAYCKGTMARLKDPKEAKGYLETADKLNPGVGRFLELLGYVNWRLNDRNTAVRKHVRPGMSL